MLKVIDVWRQRDVYPNEFVDPLYHKLLEQSGIDAGYLIKHKSKKIKTYHLRGLAETMDKKKQLKGQTALDVSCPQWVFLSEKLAQSFENRSKIQQLDKRLGELFEQDEKAKEDGAELDETEITCKIEEYKMTVNHEIEFVKVPMLQAANVDWQGRLENMMLKELVLLDRIDNLVNRLDQLEGKLEK